MSTTGFELQHWAAAKGGIRFAQAFTSSQSAYLSDASVIAAITLTLLVTNCPHFISVSYSSVDWTVATKAERDQIAFIIGTTVAAKQFVVDFKVGHGTAHLTSPAISPQHLLATILIFLLLEPDRGVFRQGSIHWIFWFMSCTNVCCWFPGRNLKKFESVRRRTSGSPLSRFAPARKSAQIISRQ